MWVITRHKQSIARYIYWSLNFIIGDIQRNNSENLDHIMHVWDDLFSLYVIVSVWITFTFKLIQSIRYEGRNFECNITTPYQLNNIHKFWVDELKKSVQRYMLFLFSKSFLLQMVMVPPAYIIYFDIQILYYTRHHFLRGNLCTCRYQFGIWILRPTNKNYRLELPYYFPHTTQKKKHFNKNLSSSMTSRPHPIFNS